MIMYKLVLCAVIIGEGILLKRQVGIAPFASISKAVIVWKRSEHIHFSS